MSEVEQDRLRLGRRVLSKRVVKFIAVGGACAVVQLSVLHGLVSADVEEHLANLIAFIISMELNFVLHQFVTWRDRWSPSLHPAKLLGRLLLFNASASTTGVINQGVFAIFNLFIWYLPAAAIGIGVAAFTNFLLNDRLIFRMWSPPGEATSIYEP
jgi:putative flippase GtrA